jgi:hypothetical protein
MCAFGTLSGITGEEKLQSSRSHNENRKAGRPRCRWLTPVILAVWEVEIRKTEVQSQLEQIVCETLS